jgi:hypothetical protein
MHTKLRMELGRVYLELMYYADEVKNAQLAIDCFEVVLEKSKESDQLVKASNSKTEALYWKFITEEPLRYPERNEESPLEIWTKDVAMTYQDDPTAMCYYALLQRTETWIKKEDLLWFHLAWSLVQRKNQPPPPSFHYMFSIFLNRYYNDNEEKFGDLPILISSLEHFRAFAANTSLKELYIIQRFVAVFSCVYSHLLYWPGGEVGPVATNRFTPVY